MRETYLKQFCALLQQQYWTGFQPTLKETYKPADIPFTFKDKRISHSKITFNYKNAQEPIKKPEACFRIEYFNKWLI